MYMVRREQRMSKVLILSHIDADGLCSARIIAKMEERSGNKVDVRFQVWDFFGVRPTDLEYMKNYDIVYVLDLGAYKSTLDTLSELIPNTEVWLIDHHPSDCEIARYRSDKFKILHLLDHCTASLCYELYKANYETVDDWSKIWTVVGIYGDVATDKLGASQVLNEIKNDYPELFWNIARWTGRRESLIPVAAHIGKYLNTARRVAYHEGARLAYEAMLEVERYGNYEILESLFTTFELEDKMLEVKFPKVAILKYWYRDWVKFRDEVFERTNIVNIETPNFYISFINHPWDIGGYVAGIKSSKRPAFCVNEGVPADTHAKITGRGNGSPPLNEIGRIVEDLSEGKVTWGGHPEAVSGWVHRALDRKEVVKFIEDAFKTYRRGGT